MSTDVSPINESLEPNESPEPEFTEPAERHRGKRVMGWVALILGLLVLAGAVFWFTTGKDDQRSSILGFRPYIVSSGSMSPTYKLDSIILTRHTPIDNVHRGDVVVFIHGTMTVTHRAIQVNRTDGHVTSIIVRGDNNPHPDLSAVTPENFLGTVVYHNNASSWLVQQYHAQGVVRIIIIPLALVAIGYFGWRQILAGRVTRTAKVATTLGVAAAVMVMGTVIQDRYLHEKEQHIQDKLVEVAADFRASALEEVWVEEQQVVGTIQIPKLDLDLPVVEFGGSTSLDVGIAYYDGPHPNTAGNEDGEPGANTVFVGNPSWGNLFLARMNQLKAGDVISVTGMDLKTEQYLVTGERPVNPYDTSIGRQPANGTDEITLAAMTYDGRLHEALTAVKAADQSVTQAVVPAPSLQPLPGAAKPAAIATAALVGFAGLFYGAVAWLRRRRDADEPPADTSGDSPEDPPAGSSGDSAGDPPADGSDAKELTTVGG